MQQRIEETGAMDAPCGYNALNDRYVSACERHGTSPHDVISAAFDKVRCQHTKKEKQTLELLLDQTPETNMEPLIEMLSAVESSDLDAVDVAFSNTLSNLRWPLLVQVMRAAGSKLRMADLSDNVIGREAVRELLHGGINCQNMDLSFSRIRKLEMLGHFPNLHTLKLDCIPVTCLPEGCFCAMPKLAKLSMCGTSITNLWTASAALRKLLALRELCFQKCLCCQGTGQCAAQTACLQSDDASWREGRLYEGVVGRTLRRSGDEYESHDYAPSDFSGSGDDLEHLLTYSEPEPNQLSENWTVDPAEDSDAEQAVPNLSQGMDDVRGDNPNYRNFIRVTGEDQDDPENGDTIADEELRSASEQLVTLYDEDIVGNYGRHALLDFIDLDDSSILPESMASIEGIPSDASVAESGVELGSDDADISMLEAPERVVVTRTNHTSREAAALIQEAKRRSTFRLSGDSGEGASDQRAESSGEDGEEPCPIKSPESHLEWVAPDARRAFMAVSPICDEKSYREFMITMLPTLQVLDNMVITEAEKKEARCVFEEQFEPLANSRRVKESVLQVLKRRETGGSGVRAPCGSRLGYVGNERSPAAYTRSLSAAKMGTNAWPATKTVCRVKNPDFDVGRRCQPRQFEYHPTEPSYMVLGTLQGEVVVINHESDKVVGYVQSIGAPHSILGLCWLNKDPNKLIAGSDNGSLQLYDVNHMRASLIAANRRGVSSNVSSRYQPHGNENWGRQAVPGSGRSPALYTYDDFEQLTSVHINSTDDYFVASGYSNHVGLYDLHTGTQLQVFSDIHKEHINVVKFANHSPQIFATSSFDKEIKMWDLRQKVTQPLYTVRSNRGNVMVCFSRDDHYLLSSAVDNEVRQYLAMDGRLHMKLDITPMSSSLNYTRSYYLNGRDYIISGSCEENVVRVCCAQTGRRLRDLTVEGRGSRNSLYVQSLRGDPFKDFHFCMLVAYNHPHSRSEIVKVNLLGGESQGEDHEFQPQQMSLTGLGA